MEEVLIIICSPSQKKKAVPKGCTQYNFVTTDKPNTVVETIVKNIPRKLLCKLRFHHVSTSMINHFGLQLKERLNGLTPPIEVVRNPHEKGVTGSLIGFVKVI